MLLILLRSFLLFTLLGILWFEVSKQINGAIVTGKEKAF